MGYQAAIDLGTTYTAAAVWRDGDARPEIVTLASRSAAMPTVVHVGADGAVTVGDAAEARATDDPTRVVREFKRRLGDPAPILVGASPWSPEALLAEVLKAAVHRIAGTEGAWPDRLVLTHPASWGPFRLEQFGAITRLAGLPEQIPVAFVPEPVAAAVHYASGEKVAPGTTIAVYDLGGGTFDATVLRVTADGRPEILGAPEGIDRLGGIDVDAAVFAQVQAGAEDLFARVDPDDPLTAAALAQLRSQARQAKESLSENNQTAVVVALPVGMTQVRVTRAELEAAIGPQIQQTVAALSRAIAGAQLTPQSIDRVLLVGGASRMPMVASAVSAALARPVAIDADPKHAIALGAVAWERRAATTAATTAVLPAVPPAVPPTEPDASPPPAAAPVPAAPVSTATATAMPGGEPARRSKTPLVVAALVVLVAGVAGGWFVFLRDDGTGDGGLAVDVSTTTTDGATTTTVDGVERRQVAFGTDENITIPEGDLHLRLPEVADGDALIALGESVTISAADEGGSPLEPGAANSLYLPLAAANGDVTVDIAGPPGTQVRVYFGSDFLQAEFVVPGVPRQGRIEAADFQRFVVVGDGSATLVRALADGNGDLTLTLGDVFLDELDFNDDFEDGVGDPGVAVSLLPGQMQVVEVSELDGQPADFTITFE